MKNYLITGTAGTGKSAIGEVLVSKGYRVLEFDGNSKSTVILKEYRQRFDTRTNQPSEYKRGDGWDEIQYVKWKVDADKLRSELQGSENEVQFVCGYANNWGELKNDFDGMFVLVASPDTIKSRLLNRTSGDWGQKHPEELKHAVDTAQDFNNTMIGLGAIAISAEQPINDIVSEIIENIQRIAANAE